MGALMAGAIAAPIIGGILGNEAARGDREASMQAISNARAQFDNINIPEVAKQQLILKSLQSQGQLTPEMISLVQQGPNASENIQIDPRLKQAQMNALESLSKMGQQGLTAEDTAALNQSRRQIAGDEQARQNSLLQSMAQRGMGGSGMELAARLQSSQGSADRASQESDRTMAMAQNRMLQSLSQAGNLGSQLQGQEFGQQMSAAQARDAISRFNAEQQASNQIMNVSARNQAAAVNLGEKQRIADTNVNLSNAQEQRNKDLTQQEFLNKMALAGARAEQSQNMGAALSNQGKDTSAMIGGIGAGVGQGLGGLASMMGGASKGGTAVVK